VAVKIFLAVVAMQVSRKSDFGGWIAGEYEKSVQLECMLHPKGQNRIGGDMKQFALVLMLIATFVAFAAERQFVLFEIGTGTW
jgi:hypothetical protein